MREPTRRPAHRGQDARRIPYDMFDLERTEREAETARRLSAIYHKGQEHVWDGREVLESSAALHGGVRIDPDKARSLLRIVNNTFWGELVAWRVSATLAQQIEPLEAKMAATAQAHDEARHFYVLRDWMALAGHQPTPIGTAAARFFTEVSAASDLCRMLIGMQLMVEPVALTLFQLLRESRIEPVLSDVLVYFERDEARHIALGVNWLPTLLREMSPRERIALGVWQVRALFAEMDTLAELEPDLRALGFDPREVFRLGHKKQREAVTALQRELGRGAALSTVMRGIMELKFEHQFPSPDGPRGISARLRSAARAARN